jgi:hypothetical protein
MNRRFGKIMQMTLSSLVAVGVILAKPITARADVSYDPYQEYLMESADWIFAVCVIIVALVVGLGVFLIVLGIRKSRKNSLQDDKGVKEDEET